MGALKPQPEKYLNLSALSVSAVKHFRMRSFHYYIEERERLCLFILRTTVGWLTLR